MYKNSLKNILVPVFIAAAVVAGIFIGMLTVNRKTAGTNTPAVSVSRPYGDNKLMYALTLIDNIYVDTVGLDSLTDHAIEKLIGDLDPHSNYIPAASYAEANEALEGEFDGIGVVFNMATDTVVVLNVIPSGPSDVAGVRNGDRIIMIDDSLVAGQKINQNNIVKMLRGKRGTAVNLSLQRYGVDELVPVTVTRDVIPINSLDAAFMIQPRIGYVKLSAFAKTSIRELWEALVMLTEQGMTKLIFDIRGNSGGFLDQAIAIANEFLPAKTMIVYTEDRNRNRQEEYSNGKGMFTDIPLVVLVDEGSASSSEILAGAIQDNDRGLVIGRRTFGKGLVQQQFPFSDGSALRLTIARYYTPSGRSIQKPYADGNEEYYNDIRYRIIHNEIFSADSIKFADSLKYTTPSGRIVYGGGGIMPDIFIPYDTSFYSKYYFEVTGKNILYKYTMDYADKHREQLNKVSSVKQLDSLLDSDKELFDNFVEYASREGVKPDNAGLKHSHDVMLAQIRAYIGRNTPLDDVGFYSNIYTVDNVVLKAIEELGRMDLPEVTPESVAIASNDPDKPAAVTTEGTE